MAPRAVIPLKVRLLLGVVARSLVPLKLESGEGTMIYNLQRVMRQLRYDQGAVIPTRESATSSASVAETRFVDQAKD